MYTPFKEVPEAQRWLDLFKHDRMRYPLLLVHATSFSGKTEWAESLFKRPLKLLIGPLTQFPNRTRELDRTIHDGLILDDCRDLAFLCEHQEQLQGRYSGTVELGTTPCGDYAYDVDFFRLPIVVTVNNSTRNLSLLSTDDFVANPENVQVLCFKGRPGDVTPSSRLDL